MKKIIAFFLMIVLVCSLFSVLVSATREEEGSAVTAKSVAFSIDACETKPTIDGVINEGEYTKVELQPEWMLYVINDEDGVVPGTTGADFNLCKSTVIDFYGTYDAENLYLAWGVHVSDENYVQNWTDSLTNMHAQTALQVKIGDSYITSAWDGYDEFIKFQVARNKETGEEVGVMLHKAASVPGAKIDDITYHMSWSAEDELLIYEMQIPASVWTFGELEGESKLGICWNVCVGGNPERSWNNYSHISLAYGCSGSHGMACNGLALMTLNASSEPVQGGDDTSDENVTSDLPVIQPEDPTNETGDLTTTDKSSTSEEQTPAATVETTATAPTGTEPTTTTEAPKTGKAGCSSSLTMGGMVILLSVGTALVSLKRKD